jgi:hypothetical protein
MKRRTSIKDEKKIERKGRRTRVRESVPLETGRFSVRSR